MGAGDGTDFASGKSVVQPQAEANAVAAHLLFQRHVAFFLWVSAIDVFDRADAVPVARD